MNIKEYLYIPDDVFNLNINEDLVYIHRPDTNILLNTKTNEIKKNINDLVRTKSLSQQLNINITLYGELNYQKFRILYKNHIHYSERSFVLPFVNHITVAFYHKLIWGIFNKNESYENLLQYKHQLDQIVYRDHNTGKIIYG